MVYVLGSGYLSSRYFHKIPKWLPFFWGGKFFFFFRWVAKVTLRGMVGWPDGWRLFCGWGIGWKTAFAINCESVNERQKYAHTHIEKESQRVIHTNADGSHTHARTKGKNNTNDIQTNKSILIWAQCIVLGISDSVWVSVWWCGGVGKQHARIFILNTSFFGPLQMRYINTQGNKCIIYIEMGITVCRGIGVFQCSGMCVWNGIP